MRLDLPYARALLDAAPLGDLARAVLRRAWKPAPPPPIDFRDDAEARQLAGDALGRAPKLFTTEPLADAYRVLFPDGAARLRERATKILEHRVELFGREVELGSSIDWLRDPFSSSQFSAEDDPSSILAELIAAPVGDPKAAWELARGAHLLELGAAGRICRDLEAPARQEIASQLSSFLAQNRVGRGFHYASPLEVALRAIHWLAAIELAGGARAFPRRLVEDVAASLLGDAHFLASHLEDGGVAPANHLLGDLVGLYVLSLFLDGAPGARGLIATARVRLEEEALRQVGPDGAQFEASTGYHRFALELLLVAQLAARAANARCEVGEPLHRMFRYLRGILTPDGGDPGFGDSDDARVLPLVARPPRELWYLLPVGAALFGDPSLRPSQSRFSEEALWLFGSEAYRRWQWMPTTPDLPSGSFGSGGVHVLRSGDTYLAMRAGSYGQKGVGGHAHNDQLSLVVHAAGRPLLVDAGTGCYTRDPLVRDRFRATGAHSTVIVDGAEQSPIFEGRPFALPDRARASRVVLEDVGTEARLEAAHHGYRRLPARVTHRRRVTLHRQEQLFLIEDHLEGHGEVSVDVRFLFVGEARLGASAATVDRLAKAARLLGPVDLARVIEIDERAALVPLAGAGSPPLTSRIEAGGWSPRFGSFSAATLVSAAGRLRTPGILRHALVLLDRR